MIVAGDGCPEIDSGREFKRGNHEIGNVSDVVIERTAYYTIHGCRIGAYY